MSYQEMNYEGGNHGEEPQFYQHFSGKSGQKNLSTSDKSRKCPENTDLDSFYLFSFSIAPHWVCLLTIYLAIIAVNIYVARKYKR